MSVTVVSSGIIELVEQMELSPDEFEQNGLSPYEIGLESQEPIQRQRKRDKLKKKFKEKLRKLQYLTVQDEVHSPFEIEMTDYYEHPSHLPGGHDPPEVDLDALRAQAGVLRRSILQQQLELQKLERQIIVCSHETRGDKPLWRLLLATTGNTFQASWDVLRRKLNRVEGQVGVNNQQWHGSVKSFVSAQTQSGVRIVDHLLKNQTQLSWLVDPSLPTLVPHVPAILARLDRLERHMDSILERVLNNQRHLASIEPYLPQILERFDDIEPHMPWILDHIDVLAPYTGLLLKHIDELLPYASLDDYEYEYCTNTGQQIATLAVGSNTSSNYQYALAEQLLPYLEFYVSRLDTVGPHLPLLRPHVPKLLKHNRIAKMSPHIDRLFALGYAEDLGASANMDVLLFWFGWALRVPGLPRFFFAIPGSPRIVTFLANRLPKRFVRGTCSGISCTVDGDYGVAWNSLSKERI